MAERIAEGALPFRDFGAQHTTSVMFFFAFLDRMAGRPLPYAGYLFVDYLATLIVGLLLLQLIAPLELSRGALVAPRVYVLCYVR